YRECAAKFSCGKESADEPDDVVTGVYASSINIHNPQAKITVAFVKKIVVALREGTTFLPPKISRGVLRPDQADRVDCAFIAKALQLSVPYVEGLSWWRSHRSQRALSLRSSTSSPNTRRGRPQPAPASRPNR